MINRQEIYQFKKDINYILEHKNSWIFEPIFAVVRRLVLMEQESYCCKFKKDLEDLLEKAELNSDWFYVNKIKEILGYFNNDF